MYLAGAFVLGIEFLEGYPSVPPEVRFLTPVSTYILSTHAHAMKVL